MNSTDYFKTLKLIVAVKQRGWRYLDVAREPRVNSSYSQKDGEVRPVGEPARDDVRDFREGKNLKARRLVALHELLVCVLFPLAQNAADNVAAQWAWHLKSSREKK